MQPTPEEVLRLSENEADPWRRAFSIRMDNVERELAKNTETTTKVEESTREVVDLLVSFKGAMKVLELLGKLARPLAYIVAFISGLGAAWVAFWPKK